MNDHAARDLGDFPTPQDVAAVLARETLTPLLGAPHPPRVVDPACGEGALLIAAADFCRRRGDWPDAPGMLGVEIHPGRARGARRALRASGATGGRIVCADALTWPPPLAGDAFDAVVANPPFLSPTARRGGLPPSVRAVVRQRLGDQLAALTNVASVFLADALALVRPGGLVGMILPQSFLTSRDSRAVREAVLRQGTLEWLWTGGEGVFPAAITVCGIVVRRNGRARSRIRRAEGAGARRVASQPFDVGAHARGEPWRAGASAAPRRPGDRTIADLATPIAGFRRHFYAVASALVDAPEGPGRPVVTAGLIDPGRILWGQREARIAKGRWQHPRYDAGTSSADHQVDPWLEATRTPKVIVATQTRVIECAPDETGDVLPGVPVIALPGHQHLWHIAAALTAPYLTRLAFDRHAGAALSPDAIKMSGAEVAALPLPSRQDAWDAGADAMRRVASAADADAWRDALDELAGHMARAYRRRGDTDPRDWWRDRLPPFRGARTAG